MSYQPRDMHGRHILSAITYGNWRLEVTASECMTDVVEVLDSQTAQAIGDTVYKWR